MRMAAIAFILLAGLTIGNIVVYRRDTADMRNPYAAPVTPAAAIVGNAAAQDAARTALGNAWLREVGALILVGALWLVISRSGAKPAVER